MGKFSHAEFCGKGIWIERFPGDALIQWAGAGFRETFLQTRAPQSGEVQGAFFFENGPDGCKDPLRSHRRFLSPLVQS